MPTAQIFKRKEFAFGDEGPYKMTPAMKAVLNRVKDITLTADKMVRIPSALYFSNVSLYLYLSLSPFLSLSLSRGLSDACGRFYVFIPSPSLSDSDMISA